MTYLHLLSPEGEPFEVIEQRAGKLLTEGWSFNPAPLHTGAIQIDEIVESVQTAEVVEPSNGAIVDAEVLANDAPVEVEAEPTTDAGPQFDEGEIPVAETADGDEKPARNKRR